MTSRRTPSAIVVCTALTLLVITLVTLSVTLSLGSCSGAGHGRRGDTTPPSGASDRPSYPSAPGDAGRR